LNIKFPVFDQLEIRKGKKGNCNFVTLIFVDQDDDSQRMFVQELQLIIECEVKEVTFMLGLFEQKEHLKAFLMSFLHTKL